MSSDELKQALRITKKAPAADGIEYFELEKPDGGEVMAFMPGAHISLRVPNGEVRKYSLCNDAEERNRYCIAVKREEGGRGGSISLIDDAKVGDEVVAVALLPNERLADVHAHATLAHDALADQAGVDVVVTPDAGHAEHGRSQFA